MLKFENIIVPTDFSANAIAAYPYAVEFARTFGGKIHLVHVFEASLYFTATAVDAYSVFSATPAGWLETKVAENEQLLAAAGQTMAKANAGIEVVTKLLKGNPVKELTHYAAQQPSAMIVMATHGYTGLAHAMLGSVAERIVRTSPCTVLTVRPQKEPAKQ